MVERDHPPHEWYWKKEIILEVSVDKKEVPRKRELVHQSKVTTRVEFLDYCNRGWISNVIVDRKRLETS